MMTLWSGTWKTCLYALPTYNYQLYISIVLHPIIYNNYI
ncbi:hypothetical protein PDIG_30270 [Penicillium digitatum PHI26]|uniref:Uncharacterized protein n=2 Tax=Penicillium digitatum TaxID=36651 RepID=K9GJR2_PEND2|nr:hypothetical protein PDIP_64650 [Penicillium digitatum Pd1]EKV09383.1 hypothetical protein PDIP_64650 [Penicillium digitatum Pd1]EKV14948.1 hypothetical protein PDIG_30270 [Penicillium digitatum PHI26]